MTTPQPAADTVLTERLWRLIGEDGDSSAERGGGVEVVSLFRILLEYAIDHDDVIEFDAVLDMVREQYSYKSNRLRTLYRGTNADPYRGFVLDGLAQLVHAGLVGQLAPNRWGLIQPSSELYGRSVVVIPGEGRREVAVGSLAPRHIREMADRMDRLRHELSRLHDYAAQHGFLDRELNAEEVATLTDSMRRHGEFWGWRPLVYDQYGRLLDGHHRYAAAVAGGLDPATLPAERVEVDDDLDAAWIAFDANLHHGWTEAELAAWHAATKVLGKRGDQRNAAMQLIEWHLRYSRDGEGKPLSNVEIARQVGVSEGTVRNARTELVAQFPTDSQVANLSETEQAEEVLHAHPTLTTKAVAELIGVDERTVQRARKRLVDAGEIDKVPRPEQQQRPTLSVVPDLAPKPAGDKRKGDPPVPPQVTAAKPEPEQAKPTVAAPERPKTARQRMREKRIPRVELEPVKADDFDYLAGQTEAYRQRCSQMTPAAQWYIEKIIAELRSGPFPRVDARKVAQAVLEAMD